MKLQLVVSGAVVDEAVIAVRGDVNADGKVSTLDVRAMLAASLSGSDTLTAAQRAAGDLDKSGAMNTIDVRTMLKEFVA